MCSPGLSWSWKARRTWEGTSRYPGSFIRPILSLQAPNRATRPTHAGQAPPRAAKARPIRRESFPARNAAGQSSELSHPSPLLWWRRRRGSADLCKADSITCSSYISGLGRNQLSVKYKIPAGNIATAIANLEYLLVNRGKCLVASVWKNHIVCQALIK